MRRPRSPERRRGVCGVGLQDGSDLDAVDRLVAPDARGQVGELARPRRTVPVGHAAGRLVQPDARDRADPRDGGLAQPRITQDRAHSLGQVGPVLVAVRVLREGVDHERTGVKEARVTLPDALLRVPPDDDERQGLALNEGAQSLLGNLRVDADARRAVAQDRQDHVLDRVELDAVHDALRKPHYSASPYRPAALRIGAIVRMAATTLPYAVSYSLRPYSMM